MGEEWRGSQAAALVQGLGQVGEWVLRSQGEGAGVESHLPQPVALDLRTALMRTRAHTGAGHTSAAPALLLYHEVTLSSRRLLWALRHRL